MKDTENFNIDKLPSKNQIQEILDELGMLDENGRVSGGSIKYEGYDLAKFKSTADWLKIRGKRIATIFQDPMTSLNPLLTIGFQISEVLRLHHGLSKQEAKEEYEHCKAFCPRSMPDYDEYMKGYDKWYKESTIEMATGPIEC